MTEHTCVHTIVVIIHILLIGFCSSWVYIISVKFLKITHGEILSEELFSEFYAGTFSDCLSNTMSQK